MQWKVQRQQNDSKLFERPWQWSPWAPGLGMNRAPSPSADATSLLAIGETVILLTLSLHPH